MGSADLCSYMPKAREKLLAKELYLYTSLNQKEIAERIGVREQTLSGWVRAGGWEDLKSASHITREHLLKNAYRQLDRINAFIEEQGGIPNKKLNDAKSTVIREIQALERHESLSLYVAVMEKFLLFVTVRDPKLARQLSPLQLEFLESRSNETQG